MRSRTQSTRRSSCSESCNSASGGCLIARQGDLRQFNRDMTATLHGRGGGKPLCQQGRVQAAKEEIEAFFADRQ